MSKVAKLKAGAATVNDDNQKPSNLPIKELCNNGNLVLLVGEDFGPVQPFCVSCNTLCMVSPVWRAMLSGEIIQSKLNEIPFADDEPEASLLVLRIAHLRFHEIPQQLPDES
jgi:hypothetical protein